MSRSSRYNRIQTSPTPGRRLRSKFWRYSADNSHPVPVVPPVLSRSSRPSNRRVSRSPGVPGSYQGRTISIVGWGEIKPGWRGFVSGYRFSDTAGFSKSDAPLGAHEPVATSHRLRGFDGVPTPEGHWVERD